MEYKPPKQVELTESEAKLLSLIPKEPTHGG